MLTGRRQNGTRVGSSIGTVDDGGTVTRRTIGRSLPICISTLDNRVSPTRPATARWRYPYRKTGDGGGGRGRQRKRKPFCNGTDRASVMREYPPRKGADFRHGLDGREDVQHFDRGRR
jgi:hypothetical protein